MRKIDADALVERVKEAIPQGSDRDSFLELIAFAPSFDTPRIQLSKRREDLLTADYDTLTAEEKVRYHRCKAIPAVIVELCQREQMRLHDEIHRATTGLEKKMDVIDDYLNGYNLNPEDELPF